MPNGQYPTVLAGQVLTATLLQSFAPFWAYKTVDTSLTSQTALQNDPDLALPIAANARYFFVMVLDYEGGTRGSSDIKIGWTFPAGTTMRYTRLSVDQTGASTVGFMNTQANTPIMGTNGAGVLAGALMAGTIYAGSTAGTLQLQWAQNVSSATATIVHAQSALAMLRMA